LLIIASDSISMSYLGTDRGFLKLTLFEASSMHEFRMVAKAAYNIIILKEYINYYREHWKSNLIFYMIYYISMKLRNFTQIMVMS